MTAADSAIRLRRRFAQLLLLAAIPVVIAIGILVARSLAEVRASVIRAHVEAQEVRRAGLEQLVAGVTSHVAVMRSFAEGRLAGAATLPPYEGPLDWPGRPRGTDRPDGVLLARPGGLVGDAARDLTAILPLFDLVAAVHQVRPELQWSYYFAPDRQFVAIHPWADPAGFIGSADPAAALDGYFDYPVFTLGLAADNPAARPYWTPVYLDAGGAGLMVSHAAPVQVGGQFHGIVGTDLLLDFVSDFLAGFPAISGDQLVIDQAGNVIAASRVMPPADGPVAVAEILGDLPAPAGDFRPQGDRLVAVTPIGGTPWQLVMTIPLLEIRAAMWREITPIALVLAAIAAGFVILVWQFRRQFVDPAVALAAYGALAPDAALAAGPPGVGGPWQALADRIGAAAVEQKGIVRQLRAMIDGIPLRVAYVDDGLIYRDANREFLTFIGKRPDEVIGRSVRAVLGPVVEAQYHAMTPAIRRMDVGRFEGWIDYPDHGLRYLQVSVLPYLAEGRSHPGFLTFSRDLTDLKTAEREIGARMAELREREQLYRSVVAAALDAVIVMDEAGNAVEFNAAAEQIFGYTAAEAIGRPVGDLIVPPAVRAAHRGGMARYLATGDAHVIGRRVEVEAMRRDGSLIPVELAITEARSATGGRVFTSHLRDLTESRRMAREMEEGRERLHQVEKLSAMGSLLAGVAHELNNPLAIVVAQATLLAARAEDDDIRSRADRISAAAARCGRIVKSFLAMARQKPPQRERLDMAAVLAGSAEIVAYGLRSAGVAVENLLPADLPAVEGDRDLLGQVFSNILINAQQALTARPLPRHIRLSAQVTGAHLRIRIEDNGPGVPEAVRARIFDPYFTTKAVEVGTGIGLSISRSVIEAHGGTITLGQGDLGGACFDIALPVMAAVAAADLPGDQQAPPPPRARILIVDDEADVAASLAEILALRGHDCVVLSDPAAALALVQADHVDAVLTDLRMPGMDGVDLTRAIAAAVPRLTGHMAVMTGDTVAGPAQIAAKSAAHLPVLAKPFEADEIARVLNLLLGSGAAG